MRGFSLQIVLLVMAAIGAEAQNNLSANHFTEIVFSTISGPVRNALIYAPTPVVRCTSIPAQTKHLRGVYKLDLDNGLPYDVRVVHSTGYKCIDDAALATLRTWRFRPHRLVWATVPIEFTATNPTEQKRR